MLKCYLCSRHPLRQTAARRPARTVFAANSDNMQINKAEFKCSSERISQVPKDALKDIAFIGRSNVGKSSLINMLTGRQGLKVRKNTFSQASGRVKHTFCAWMRTVFPAR